MDDDDAAQTLHESLIPIPCTISVEAQAILARMADLPAPPQPNFDDDDGWRAAAAAVTGGTPEVDEALALVTTAAVPSDVVVEIEDRWAGFARWFVAQPEGGGDEHVLLFIHGGGFLAGGGSVARLSTGYIAANYGTRTWGVDYRELPDDRFPSGLDDCMSVYRALLDERPPETIAVAGQSGGANLAAALLLRARDEGLPLPAAAGLISPPPTSLSRATPTAPTTSRFPTVV